MAQAAAGPLTALLKIVSGYDAWCGVAHGCTKKLGMKICGKFVFLLLFLREFGENKTRTARQAICFLMIVI